MVFHRHEQYTEINVLPSVLQTEISNLLLNISTQQQQGKSKQKTATGIRLIDIGVPKEPRVLNLLYWFRDPSDIHAIQFILFHFIFIFRTYILLHVGLVFFFISPFGFRFHSRASNTISVLLFP